MAPPPPEVTELADLNTGQAYLKTHKERITEDKEVLSLVQFYVDGATTGQFNDLPVTPLKIALGIHNRETRDKEWAWRTIDWIPTVWKAKAKGEKIVKESGHMEADHLDHVDQDPEEVEQEEAVAASENEESQDHD